MPNLSREEVLRIATLARLKLSDAEVADYQEKLGRVLEHITELNSVKTQADAFVRHVPADAVAFREDVPVPYTDVDALLKNAPTSHERSFLLPKVVEHT